MAARRRRRRGNGQAMVEFALVLPVLVLLVAGIVEFGHIFSDSEAVIAAARDGARYGSIHPSANTAAEPAAANTIQGTVEHSGTPAQIKNDGSIVVSYYIPTSGTSPVFCGQYNPTLGAIVDVNNAIITTCDVPGNMVDVKVTYVTQPLTPILKAFVGSGTTTKSDAMMLIEAT